MPWNRSDMIAATATGIAFCALAAAWLVVPEVRDALGLDDARKPTQTLASAGAAPVVETVAASEPRASQPPADPRCSTFVTPVLQQKGDPEQYAIGEDRFTRYHLTLANRDEYPRALFAVARDLAPCGLNNESSRTWITIYDANGDRDLYGFCALTEPEHLDGMWFAVAAGEAPPSRVYITLEDRRCDRVYRSNTIDVRHHP